MAPATAPDLQLLAAGNAHPMFSLLAVMLTAVVVVSLLLLRARQSLLVGYFICGILIANTGIIERLGGADSTGDTHVAVQQMAEFGVMLLMFVLGLEFSITELRFLRRFALVGGALQMGLCLLLVTAIAKVTGLSWPASIILGVTLAMSSTAVSLKTFQDLGLSGNPGARFALGVAIFQDIFIIAFLVFLPLLLSAGDYGDHSMLEELGLLLLRGGAFIVLAWINARWVVPRLLGAVVRTDPGNCSLSRWSAAVSGLHLSVRCCNSALPSVPLSPDWLSASRSTSIAFSPRSCRSRTCS